MITEFILSTFAYLVNEIMSFFDLGTNYTPLSTDFVNSFHTAYAYYFGVDDFIPMNHLVTVIGIILIVETGIWTYKGFMWVVKRFHK